MSNWPLSLALPPRPSLWWLPKSVDRLPRRQKKVVTLLPTPWSRRADFSPLFFVVSLPRACHGSTTEVRRANAMSEPIPRYRRFTSSLVPSHQRGLRSSSHLQSSGSSTSLPINWMHGPTGVDGLGRTLEQRKMASRQLRRTASQPYGPLVSGDFWPSPRCNIRPHDFMEKRLAYAATRGPMAITLRRATSYELVSYTGCCEPLVLRLAFSSREETAGRSGNVPSNHGSSLLRSTREAFSLVHECLLPYASI